MIIKNNLTTPYRNGRMEAEYTCDCGWIDWGHAKDDREDLVQIWSQLPHSSNKGQDLKRTKIGGNLYYEVTFTIAQSVPQIGAAIFFSVPRTLTYYVLDKGTEPAVESFYKQAALNIFMWGCNVIECVQLIWLDNYHHSGYSMEDLVSNLLAFYMHVEGMSKKDIVLKCGGWEDPSEAKKKSLEVLDAMEQHKAEQEKASDCFKAFLFNKISAIRPGDNRNGWYPIPVTFQRYQRFPATPQLCYHQPVPDFSSDKKNPQVSSASPAPLLSSDQAEKLGFE